MWDLQGFEMSQKQHHVTFVHKQGKYLSKTTINILLKGTTRINI